MSDQHQRSPAAQALCDLANRQEARIVELKAEVALLRDLLLSASIYVTEACARSTWKDGAAYGSEAEFADDDRELLNRIHDALAKHTGG